MATKSASSAVIPGIISAPAKKASTPAPATNGSKMGGAGLINPYVAGKKGGK